jgi:uncharacterized protein (DUF4415 family)
MSANNTVKFKLDTKHPAPLTAAQRKRLQRIAAMPDTAIDYSDIPRQTGKVAWTRPGALVPTENKQMVTLRLDADVLKFFKGTGKRYQSRINAVLRAYVEAKPKFGTGKGKARYDPKAWAPMTDAEVDAFIEGRAW